MRHFAVLRHSERLDSLPMEDQLALVRFQIIRSAQIENVGQSQSCMVSKLRIIWKQMAAADRRCHWTDRDERPYDPPIVDWQLPAVQAQSLKAFGIQRIVSSPFRRCLQTAGVVARCVCL